jgi:hypothetical protein
VLSSSREVVMSYSHNIFICTYDLLQVWLYNIIMQPKDMERLQTHINNSIHNDNEMRITQ